jgi:hypothetical protein
MEADKPPDTIFAQRLSPLETSTYKICHWLSNAVGLLLTFVSVGDTRQIEIQRLVKVRGTCFFDVSGIAVGIRFGTGAYPQPRGQASQTRSRDHGGHANLCGRLCQHRNCAGLIGRAAAGAQCKRAPYRALEPPVAEAHQDGAGKLGHVNCRSHDRPQQSRRTAAECAARRRRDPRHIGVVRCIVDCAKAASPMGHQARRWRSEVKRTCPVHGRSVAEGGKRTLGGAFQKIDFAFASPW